MTHALFSHCSPIKQSSFVTHPFTTVWGLQLPLMHWLPVGQSRLETQRPLSPSQAASHDTAPSSSKTLGILVPITPMLPICRASSYPTIVESIRWLALSQIHTF